MAFKLVPEENITELNRCVARLCRHADTIKDPSITSLCNYLTRSIVEINGQCVITQTALTGLINPINKDIPMPDGKHGGKRNKGESKYPYLDMEVGDSFFVAAARVNTLSAYFSAAGRKTGKKYATKTVTDGVRVWRVK